MTVDPSLIGRLDLEKIQILEPELYLPWLKRAVSGTYRNPTPSTGGAILELRVDVDGRRPQNRLSGDLYTQLSLCGFPITFYAKSFVVETVTENVTSAAYDLSGSVRYYADPTNTADSIKVHIPRVNIFSSPAAACIEWYTGGTLVRSYLCPKISEYFRLATLEIDRFQGTAFPPSIDPDIAPAPSGLPASVSVRDAFLRAGVDLTVVHDDTLNDPDSGDPGSNWSVVELHDLMENRFDTFGNRLQWNLYGVVVPRFGDPNYDSTYYGTMFDWGGWQVGDANLRQGFAIAQDALRGRSVGTLYDSNDEKDRLILETLIHEVGHAFNLPHSWQRTNNADAGSESFMNYPWGYTDNGGTESAFWSNFAWEFDDVELIWMRHADRNDVIFGGRDWIGNNLAVDLNPAFSEESLPVELEIQGPVVFDLGVPVQLELRLTNVSDHTVWVVDRLQPEDGLARVIIERPNGEIVEFIPPVRRLLAPPDPVELPPGEELLEVIGISFGAKGHHFTDPGSYKIRVFWPCFPFGFIATAMTRIRIAHPQTRRSEELAHLLTGREAAQFLYYGGGRNDPELRDQLLEAIDRYSESDPAAVRHIAAALSLDAGRAHKRVEVKEGKPVVVATEPQLDQSIELLDIALGPLPDEYRRRSAFAPLAESALVARLAGHVADAGDKDRAGNLVQEAVDRLEEDGAGHAVEPLQRLNRNLKRRKS